MATSLPAHKQVKMDGLALSVQDIDVAGTATIGTLSMTNVTLGSGGKIDLDSATGTFSSNAVTVTKWAAVLTTESLSTAHTASQALAVTLTGVAAGDLAFAQIAGGTNTGGIPDISKVVCTTNTVTITLRNLATSTNAFNGTFVINLVVFKA